MRHFTVWQFTSPTTGEVATVARYSEPDDIRYQHHYQKVIWQGSAWSKSDAMAKAAAA